jgi:hypothetical protein
MSTALLKIVLSQLGSSLRNSKNMSLCKIWYIFFLEEKNSYFLQVIVTITYTGVPKYSELFGWADIFMLVAGI